MDLMPSDDRQVERLPDDMLLDQRPAVVYVTSLNSRDGRRTMRQALDTIAAALSSGKHDALTFPWERLRYQHTQAIRTWLVERYKPATVNKMLSALRGVLKQAWMMGLMSAEDYHKARAVKSVKGETIPAGRELTREELRRLLAACTERGDKAAVRDMALLTLLYGAGLRRAEVVALNLEDYEQESGRLIVRGKGRKERVAYLIKPVAQAMAAWLAIRGDAPGPLFYPVRRGGHLEPRRMTTQAIYNTLRRRAAQAGVRDFSPHDLRRTFVSDLLDAGADIAIVAKMAGHASVQTTARYDRRPEEAKRRAANLLTIPLEGLDTEHLEDEPEDV
ncbi:MAG: tyrosine-type recombinase/integrase [Anaerolineae bacterium]